MRKVLDGLVPPGGWHFKAPEGYRVPASGEAIGFDDLVERVTKFRLENQIPTGDAEADVDSYLCATFPHLCGQHMTPRGAFVVNSASQERYVDVVLAWANNLLNYVDKGQIDRVPQSEADRRGECCRACPLNRVWEDQCGACTSTAQRALATIRNGQDISHWQKVHYCAHHRFEARTAIWLGRHTFGPVTSPSNCWLQ